MHVVRGANHASMNSIESIVFVDVSVCNSAVRCYTDDLLLLLLTSSIHNEFNACLASSIVSCRFNWVMERWLASFCACELDDEADTPKITNQHWNPEGCVAASIISDWKKGTWKFMFMFIYSIVHVYIDILTLFGQFTQKRIHNLAKYTHCE